MEHLEIENIPADVEADLRALEALDEADIAWDVIVETDSDRTIEARKEILIAQREQLAARMEAMQNTLDLLDYKIATMLDAGPIDTILVETGMGYGPYGVVGIGEDVATVVPALLGPAVYNATGVWVDDYPITPDKVLKALGKV